MMQTSFLKNKYYLFFLVYIIVLIMFAVFCYKIIFHDTWEYIALIKSFAGFLNSEVFSVHSLVYPFFMSLFVRYLPSMLTIKLINICWIILIGALLYKVESKKTAFLIWAFSPVVWLVSVQISPILATSFFLFVAYLSISKWQENKKNSYFIISAAALGLSAAFYDLSVVLAIFFIFVFFYNKKFKKVISYSVLTLLAFSIRLMLEASLFSLAIKDKLVPFPIYSLVRFWGAMLVINLGLHPMIPVSKLSLFSLNTWYFLIIISPLLFYLYKVDYQKNKSVIIFLILSTILFIFQGGGYLYFILIAPITILLLSSVLKRRDLLLHISVSSIIILITATPYFVPDKQEIEKRNLIINDLKIITKDFSFDAVVFDTKTLAMFYIWDKNLPYFISKDEYNKLLKNNQYTQYYTFETKSKIGAQILELQVRLKNNLKEGIDYKNLPWLLEKEETPPEGYRLIKCYDLLCVYQKETT